MTSRPADWRSILADPKDHTRLIWKKAFGNTLTAGFTFEEGLEMMAGKKIHATSPAEQKEMEKHFKMVGDDLVVLSADRVPIPVLVFLKGDAIELPAKPHQENKIKDVFEHSTRSLYSTDPSRKNFHPLIPTIPPKTDARHIHHAARREDFTEQEYGATYLIVQQEQGHDDRVCASGVILGEGARSMTGEEAEKEAQALAKRQAKKAGKRPPRKKSIKLPISWTRMAKVAKFYQDMTPNFECAAAIFKAIDPDMYKEYAACYKRTICSISGLKNVQNPYSVWCSMVIITNLNVDAHRDRTDRRDGWVLVQCFGDFRDGGHTVCPELGLKFNMRPGDIMLMRSAMLEHYVTSWKEGKRVSCVFWTHAGMFTWGLPKEGEKQEPASPDVTAPPDSRAARRRRAREAKAASDYNASQPQVHLPPCATHSAKHQSKTENMPEKERKWDWARWRKQQDAKEAEQAALLAHEVRTVLPQPLGPGLGEGVGYSERAGGVRAMDLSWKTEAEAKGQHQTGETIRTTIRANGKGMRRGNAEESRKVDSAAQTHAPAASKRMHQDSDGEDDEEPLYTMATVEDPYGLATDLVMVS